MMAPAMATFDQAVERGAGLGGLIGGHWLAVGGGVVMSATLFRGLLVRTPGMAAALIKIGVFAPQ